MQYTAPAGICLYVSNSYAEMQPWKSAYLSSLYEVHAATELCVVPCIHRCSKCVQHTKKHAHAVTYIMKGCSATLHGV